MHHKVRASALLFNPPATRQKRGWGKKLKTMAELTNQTYAATIGEIYELESLPFHGSKGETYEGHFSVKLFMGGARLNWDIKPEDFEAVREVFLSDGKGKPFIVNTGFSTHNTMCFQYVKKDDCEYCFNVLKSVLEKRLVKQP